VEFLATATEDAIVILEKRSSHAFLVERLLKTKNPLTGFRQWAIYFEAYWIALNRDLSTESTPMPELEKTATTAADDSTTRHRGRQDHGSTFLYC
jgi:hypothetical protein